MKSEIWLFAHTYQRPFIHPGTLQLNAESKKKGFYSDRHRADSWLLCDPLAIGAKIRGLWNLLTSPHLTKISTRKMTVAQKWASCGRAVHQHHFPLCNSIFPWNFLLALWRFIIKWGVKLKAIFIIIIPLFPKAKLLFWGWILLLLGVVRL